MQNDFCLEMFATSKDKPCHIEATARDRHFWRYVTWAQRFASMADEHRLVGCTVQLSRGGASRGCLCGVRQAESAAARSSWGERRVPGQGGTSRKVTESRSSRRGPGASLEGSDHCAALQVGCHHQDEEALRGSTHLLACVQEILRQARASDADALHSLTCECMEMFEADLVKIAAGDVSNIPQDLLAEEAVVQRIPLSRQASEGVHRQSRLVNVSAPTSATPWIPVSARMHQNIEWARSWVENENPDAAAAFDFEWMNAKRIAQLRQGQRGHRPVQNKLTDVCNWVCRLKRWRILLLARPAGRSRSSMIRERQKLNCCS